MLVAYASSDEDEEEEIKPTKPAKIAKREAPTSIPAESGNDVEGPVIEPNSNTIGTPPPQEVLGPAPGPPVDLPQTPIETETVPPLSPYSFRRQQIYDLTLPTIPDFSIPDSPPPPPIDSEAAARLAVTTKKFNKFLELKRQGVHFNAKLESSVSLRNPNLLPKLMQFAGISQEDSYASSLPEELAVPTKWDEECYVEALLRNNKEMERKRLANREKIEFTAGRTHQSASEPR